MENMVRVPVIVDSVKGEPLSAARCNYFSVRLDAPLFATFQHLDDRVPMLVLDLSAVLLGPVDGFLSPASINEQFEQLERAGQFLVETPDIFIPTNLIERAGIRPMRGLVLRLSHGMFLEAFLYRTGRIERGAFDARLADLEDPIARSDEETAAFARWSESEVDRSRDGYRRMEEQNRALQWGGRE